MSLVMPISDAEIEVYHQNTPDSDEPDTVIGSSPINSVSLDTRIGQKNDEFSVDLDNKPSIDLRLGDRIKFIGYVNTEGGGDGYGVNYGVNYGGARSEIPWTGLVQGPDNSRDHEGVLGASLSADATDYVGGILKERKISGGWIDDDVGAIIRDIVDRKASEVDATAVPDFGVQTDLFLQNADCWDTIMGLAARADAIITCDGQTLNVEAVNSLDIAFELTDSDYLYPFDVSVENDVKNVIRVNSGTSRQEEQTQEVQDSWSRVTESSRLTHRIRARKSAIHSIDLYVRKVSDEDITVRFQSDENGSPVAIDNNDSNIDSSTWSSEDLPDEGWQSFFFGDHVLPDRDPWLIIETGGSEGHDVAIDSNGVPTYKSYYPHPLSFEDQDTDSIDEYGAREDSVERENLDTLLATQHAVQQELARKAWPTKDVTFQANSARAHSLKPGHILQIDEPDQNAVGDFIVTEVSHTFDAGNLELQTDVTATWRKGVLAP